MPNEALWLIMLAVDLTIALVAFAVWGRIGLYAVIVMGVIVCNIQVPKLVRMFGLLSTLGNIVYGSIFFSTDLLSEIYGKKDARRGVWLGFFGLIGATVLMQFAIAFRPDPADTINPHLVAVFRQMPRIVAASLTAYLASQHHDIWAYHFWKEKTSGRFLWLRNNASTMVSQLIDSVVFCVIAFAGVVTTNEFLQILLTTYLFKWIIAALDTPFLYLGKYIADRRIPEDLTESAEPL